MMFMKILIHYAEIALKGGNRVFFEKRLMDNIVIALKKARIKHKITRERGRIVLDTGARDKSKAENTLKGIFGVKYFYFGTAVKRNEMSILKEAERIVKDLRKKGIKKISIDVKRSDKTFPLNSIEVSKAIGEMAHKNRIKIDFAHGEETIYLEITGEAAYFYTRKIEGLGGLPVATSGRVLCLLSGGIDSPVAAWLMMKRGCKVDFVHFHAMRRNKEVLKTKIKKITERLASYQFSSKLYLVPYHNYQLSTTGKLPDDIDLVMFKHFMLRFAEKLAKREGYKAVVLGDSVAQVASQTLDNLHSTQHGVHALVLRPLTSFDKQEIVNLAQNIQTYQDSIREYKDCCSIVARKPDTHVKTHQVEEALKKIKMDKIIDKSFKEMEKVKFP